MNILKCFNLLFLSALCLVCLLSSCEDCTFTSRNSTLIRLRFYRLNSNAVSRFVIDSVRTERGNVYRRGSNRDGIDTLSLPINPTSTNRGYYVFFRTVDARQRRDTLNVTYDRIFSVISPICGYDQQVSNLLVSPQLTTMRTEIFKNTLTINDSVNIRVYF